VRLVRPIPGWRPALRIAWRDATRSRGRSALVLVMIALPVLGVVAADVAVTTAQVSGAEALDRRLGAADAAVTVQEGVSRVVQGYDPDESLGATEGDPEAAAPTLDEVRAALGRDVAAVRRQWGSVEVRTDAGIAVVDTAVTDLADPLTRGLFRLDEGSFPDAADEVVVNTTLADRGMGTGDELVTDTGESYRIVGVGESTAYRGRPILVGPSPALAGDDAGAGTTTWLVGGGPVSWEEVRALNAIGATVLSRAVLENPPPDDQLPQEIRDGFAQSTDSAAVAVLALVVVMALMEVVLLAGPAFAVGARRQARSLALLAAAGGTPAQARRVVLASAVVLGSLGALLGVVLGLGAAAAALPLLQRFDSSWFGPFDVRWSHVAAVAAFGLLSALLAAVAPAWIASRADVVAVLAGRRGDRAPSARSPLLGVLLVGVGVAGAVAGARTSQNGEMLIAASAIPAVLGMILLVPVVVAAVARASAGLPLPLRYAARDASRHRTRTVPAVAAVAATVAGVVALGIAVTSDAAENEATYSPSLPPDTASVVVWGGGDDPWPQIENVLAREAPDLASRPLHGVPLDVGDGSFVDISFGVRGHPMLVDSWGASLGTSVLVGEDLTAVSSWLTPADVTRGERALDEGRAVVFAQADLAEGPVRLRKVTYDQEGNQVGRAVRASLPATFVAPVGPAAPVLAVLPAALAREAGLGALDEAPPVALLLEGVVEEDTEQDITEALAAVTTSASFYVERGYQAEDETVIVLLVLGVLGGVLMLGGTLTATFLALSDARPDLATLSAVGAAPRTRRAVASSYAVVVGGLGATLGALVGMVPGIAVTYPLTKVTWQSVDASGDALAGHYLDVPWLLIGVIVVALPLLTAAVVGLTARSTLPLATRLE
jgi:putative ABC transport system permease protein